MLVNRTIEFVNYRTPSNTGNGRTPLYLRSITESEKKHDRIEISEHARKRYLDNSGSPLEKAILKAIPGLERFRDDLRKTESEGDERRRDRQDELKSKMLRENYSIDEVMLTHAAKKIINHLAAK